jgi:ribosomal protein S1
VRLKKVLNVVFLSRKFLGKPEECNTSKFKVDDKIEVIVVSIDTAKKRIDVSIKRLSKTPELEYFDANANKAVDVESLKRCSRKGYSSKISRKHKYWIYSLV